MGDMQSTTPRGGKHRPGRTPSSGEGKSRGGGTKKKRGFFRRWWWAFALPPFVLILALLGTVWFVYAKTSIPAEPPAKQTTFVYELQHHGRGVWLRDGGQMKTRLPGVDRHTPIEIRPAEPMCPHEAAFDGGCMTAACHWVMPM